MGDQGSQTNGGGGYVRDQGSQGKRAGGPQANGGGGYTRYQGSHQWGGGYMKVPSPQHARVGP